MSEIKSYKDLIVWQKSIILVVEVYKLTEKFPKSEIFGLTSQMRRCSISIPSNIAEGRGRGTRKDFAHFLRVSLGSCNELETQFEIVTLLKYGDPNKFVEVKCLLNEIMKMLNIMIKKLTAGS